MTDIGLTRDQLWVLRAVYAVGERDVCPDAVLRQLETDGFTREQATAMLDACVADGTVIVTEPPAADVVRFPNRMTP